MDTNVNNQNIEAIVIVVGSDEDLESLIQELGYGSPSIQEDGLMSASSFYSLANSVPENDLMSASGFYSLANSMPVDEPIDIQTDEDIVDSALALTSEQVEEMEQLVEATGVMLEDAVATLSDVMALAHAVSLNVQTVSSLSTSSDQRYASTIAGGFAQLAREKYSRVIASLNEALALL